MYIFVSLFWQELTSWTYLPWSVWVSKLKSRIEDESYHFQGQYVLPCRTALSLSFSSGVCSLVYIPCLSAKDFCFCLLMIPPPGSEPRRR